jgi:hypothetical protein
LEQIRLAVPSALQDATSEFSAPLVWRDPLRLVDFSEFKSQRVDFATLAGTGREEKAFPHPALEIFARTRDLTLGRGSTPAVRSRILIDAVRGIADD